MTATRPPYRGLPAGARAMALPLAFFTDMAPRAASSHELFVVLWCFRLAALRRSPAVPRTVLERDPELAAALRACGLEPSGLPAAVDAAVRHGLLLASADGARLAVNHHAGARALAREGALAPVDAPAPPLPDVYSLYEENIGLLTPLIADELAEAERRYPAAWIDRAFRLAVTRNRRSWRYIERVLQRWQEEGFDDAPPGRSAADPGTELKRILGRYADRFHR